MKVGITGQSGFIGSHLYNLLSIQEDIEIIEFKNNFFKTPKLLKEFVAKCQVIVHLAAVNRHHDEKDLYEINIELTESLITACKATNSKPYVVFSSSIPSIALEVFVGTFFGIGRLIK